jgi:hypothetical protein
MITGKIHFHKASDDMLNAFGHPAVIWQGARVYLPVVLTGEDTGHPCSRCQSPVGWGRRWCFQLNMAVNSHCCERVRRKPQAQAWDWILKRLLDRQRARRDSQHGKARSQSHKRAMAGDSNIPGELYPERRGMATIAGANSGHLHQTGIELGES